MPRRILFICKFNRYRSNVALALFNKYNKNKKIQAKASGIVKGPPVLKKMQKVARKFGVSLKENPKSLSEKDYAWADLVIIIGRDIPSVVFSYVEGIPRKVIVWKLRDVEQFDLNYHEKTTRLTKEIEQRILNFLKSLGQ